MTNINRLKKEYETNFAVPDLFSKSSLHFVSRNLLSFGSSGPATVFANYGKLDSLEKEISRIGKIAGDSWIKIQKIADEIPEMSRALIVNKMWNEIKFDQLLNVCEMALENSKTKSRQLENTLFPDLVTGIMTYALSYFTLGLFTLCQNYLFERKIAELQNKHLNPLMKMINEDIKVQAEALKGQLNLLKEAKAADIFIAKIKAVDVNAARECITIINEKILTYNTLQAQHKELEEQSQKLTSESDNLKSRIQTLEKNIRTGVEHNEGRYKLDVDLSSLLKQKNVVEGILLDQKKLRHLPPRFLRTKDDMNVCGAPGINENLDNNNFVVLNESNRRYADAVNGKKTSLEVVEACFVDACTCFVESGYKAISKLNINEAEAKKNLYQLTALHLIKGAALVDASPMEEGAQRVACVVYSNQLLLNIDGIRIHSSNPIRVLTKDQKGDFVTKIIADPEHVDDFTPKHLTEQSPGIDPLSLKWILGRMSSEEIEKLSYNIIYPHLRAPEKNLQARLALKFIEEIGGAIEEKFDTVLVARWNSAEMRNLLKNTKPLR